MANATSLRTNAFDQFGLGLKSQELAILLSLFGQSSLSFSYDEELKDCLNSLKAKGLLDSLGDFGAGAKVGVAELATLTERGLDAIFDALPVPSPEILGDDLRVLLELVSQTKARVRKVETTVEAVKRLIAGGYLKDISGSADPLAQIKKDFELENIVELSRIGARLLGLGGKTQTKKLDVPLVFPAILNVHKELDSLPISQMPRIQDDAYRLSVDVSKETLAAHGFDNPFEGRDWMAVIVMYDHTKHGGKLFSHTNLFHKEVGGIGPLLDRQEVTGKAFSLFLIPTKDKKAFEILKEGEGTVLEFQDDQRFGQILDKALALAGQVQGASAMDLRSNIGKALLKEIDVDPDANADELVLQLAEVHQKLQDGKLPKAIRSGATQVAFNLLKGVLGASGLASLGIVTTAFQAFRFLYDLEHQRYFELMELEPEVENGVTLLKVKPEDVSRLRLDHNTEGPKGKDLRHILAYHYRPITDKSTRLGVILNNGRPTLALVDSTEAKKNLVVEVTEENDLHFDPSLSLSLVHLTEPLRLDNAGSEVCPVSYDQKTGQVHLTDFKRIFKDEGRKPYGVFQATIGFDKMTCEQFQLVPKSGG